MIKKVIYIVIILSIIVLSYFFTMHLWNTSYFDFDEVTEVTIRVPVNYEGQGLEWSEHKYSKEEAIEIIDYLDDLKFTRNNFYEDGCKIITYEVITKMNFKDVRFSLGCNYLHAYSTSSYRIKFSPYKASFDLEEYEVIIEEILTP